MTDPIAPLDSELEQLRRAAAERGQAPMVTLTPQEARERVAAGDRLCAAGPDIPVAGLTPENDGPPVPVRVYTPDEPRGTLVYGHGGGWVTGDLDYSDELCRFLAVDAGLRVVSVDYRLAPEHPFPAGLEDLDAAWAWAAGRYDAPLGLGGDSSGGNLAAALVNRLVARGEPPAAQLLIYPALGLPGGTASYVRNAEAFPIGRADMEWFWRHHLADSPVREPVPDLVPLHATDLTGAPPTHLVLAGHDPLHDEGAAYAHRLSSAGTPVTVTDHPDLCHGFLRFTAASAAARRARAHLVSAVERLWETVGQVLAVEPIHAYDSAGTGGEASLEPTTREHP